MAVAEREQFEGEVVRKWRAEYAKALESRFLNLFVMTDLQRIVTKLLSSLAASSRKARS